MYVFETLFLPMSLLSDIIPRFAQPLPQSTCLQILISNGFHQNLFLVLKMQFTEIGVPLQNCWGFTDGNLRPVCKPQQNQNQRIIYNRYKRIHVIKFQSVAAPNGLIAMLDGLYILGKKKRQWNVCRFWTLDQIKNFFC